MPKNRVCATDTGLPKFTRRAFVAGTAVTPFAVATPASAAGQPESEVDAYARGFKDGQRRMVEILTTKVEEIEAARPATMQARMDELAKEACQLVRSIAPKEAGAVMCYLGSNWNPHAPIQTTWHARAASFRQSPLPEGRLMWICDGMKYLNPENLIWS